MRIERIARNHFGKGLLAFGLGLLVVWPLRAAEPVMDIQTWQTGQGTQVLFYQTDSLPIVDARLIFDAGAARDEDETSGLAVLTATLLSEGAGTMSGAELSRALADLGAEFSTSAGLESAAIRLRSLSDPQWLWPAAELVAQVVQAPRFDAADFEREQRRQLLGIQAKAQSPGALAADALREAAFPGHPYGRPDSGTAETVSSLTLAALRDFHERYYVAANAILVIVGDIDRDGAAKLADLLLGGLPAGEAAEPLPPTPVIEGEQLRRVHFPSEQSTVQVAYNGIPRLDEDYFPLYVGNHVLGGSGFASRLTTHIREQRGLAYSVYSYLMPLRAGGTLVMGIQTRNDQVDEALSLMQADLEDFMREGPSAEELDNSQANIIGGFPLRLDSNAKITETLGALAFMGLPLDYFDQYRDHIKAVDGAAIRDAYAARIDPEARVVVIVGPHDGEEGENGVVDE